jgi:hypothetical protein
MFFPEDTLPKDELSQALEHTKKSTPESLPPDLSMFALEAPNFMHGGRSYVYEAMQELGF